MNLNFTTVESEILAKIDQINPVKYGSTRNFINGAVTYLSPYISRGVISTKQVLQNVLQRGYHLYQIETFVKELCWRDYFQRVAQEKDINTDIKHNQTSVSNYEIPKQVTNATMGIEGIDTAIKNLYQSGYMHNHCRMYTASVVCNIAKSYWHHPAQWMYYHLLDGDWASNACSWQWVAGANSTKKYYANQENINKYTFTKQRNTFLDQTYEAIEDLAIPAELQETEKLNLVTELPETLPLQIDKSLPTFIYNYYNLDPQWHKGEPGNRILLLEPDFFAKYPVSKKCIDFVIGLSKNIEGIQVHTGTFQSIADQTGIENIYFKEHPFNKAYKGNQEDRDWIAKGVVGYYPSFFAYWKKVEQYFKKEKVDYY